MPDLKKFADGLDRHVRPQSFPIAVRMVKAGEALPPKVRRPVQDLGFQTAICQGFAIVRRYGWSIAIGAEDLSCPLARLVFGFAPRLDYYEQGWACVGLYTQTPEAGAVTEALTEKFEVGEYQYLLAAPLHRTGFEPHVVVVYGTSGQVMRLVTAALWKRGGRITSSFSGRIDCSDAVIVTLHSGQPQVILPCYGDRIFAQTDDNEMAVSIPGGWFDEIVEGLEGTSQGGIRYPIPSFLRYTGQFPSSYERMNELWREEEQRAVKKSSGG
jgi:uncharacterized protein (DUF169 family)